MSAPTTRPFTQADLDRLHAALLDAYATLDDLARLVRNDLAANLETMVVVHGRDLAKITADLIRACCTSDARLHQLVNAAATQRADHPALPALVADWAAIRFTDLERFVLAPPDSSRRLYVNVPPMPPHFLGRTSLLNALIDRLVAGQSTAGSIAALSTDGLPGVGKTTLAVALAHHPRILGHFTDGVLWAGLGRTPNVADTQARWANALGLDLTDLADPHARAARLNDALAPRRLLLVLDDAWDWEPLDLLRCSGPHVAHILTTRDVALARRFAGQAQEVPVPVLAQAPSHALLRTLAPDAWDHDPDAAAVLADQVGGLPLALELLGGYLAAPDRALFPELSAAAFADLADPARRLQLAAARLGSVSGKVRTLEETVTLSLDALAAVAPAAVAAFYALGAFAPKPAAFDLDAAKAVAQTDARPLAQLISRSLLEKQDDATLTLHQVLSDVARPHTPADAVTRHRDHYLTRVNADRDDWQTIEPLYSQVVHAYLDAPDKVDFVDSLYHYQPRRGLWSDRLTWLDEAVAQAHAAGNQKSEARMLSELGFAYAALGDKAQALAYYEQALPLFRQVGDKAGEATTLNNIGSVYDDLGDKAQALDYYEQALPLRRQVGDKAGEATTLNNIGLVYRSLGNMDEALAYYEQSLPLSRQVGDKAGEATTLNNIGGIYSALGDKAQALGYFELALPLDRQVGDKAGEATTLNNIGSVHWSQGNQDKALDYYEQALPLSRQVGDTAGEATTLTNIGTVYDALGDKAQALAYFEQALPLQQQIGDRFGEVITRWWLGLLHAGNGDKATAEEHLKSALTIAREVGSPNAAAVRRALESLESR